MRSKRMLAILLSVFMVFTVNPMTAFAETGSQELGFADMPDNWSTAALNKAADNGLLMGYEVEGKTLIKAEDPIKRAEMAAVVNRAFNAKMTKELKGVTDIPSWAWYAEDMAKAVQMKTFALDKKMRPDDKITREEAFAVLARAFKLTGTDSEYKALDKFSDKAEISSWALKDLDGLSEAGYIQGSGEKLNPKANITRAEFAVVMDNLIKQYIDEADTVTEVTESGNVMVRVPGVTLKDVTIKGDLFIADGVGDGDVTLDNVNVEGRTVVRGGGVDSIIIKGNSSVGKVVLAKVDGEIRIAVDEDSDVEYIFVDDGSDDVIVTGAVGTIEIAGDDIKVTARQATIKNGIVNGNNSNILVEKDSTITNITVSGSNTKISGEGEVKEVKVAEGGDNAAITTPNTKVEVAKEVEGVTGGGGAEIEAGTTIINSKDGMDVVAPPTPSGGSSIESVSAISVEGVPVAGSTLTAKTTPTNAKGNYQWFRAEEEGEYDEIDGATAKTYTLTNEDVGKYIKVTIEGTGSYKGTATSDPFGIVGKPAKSIYKLSYAGLADSYAVVDDLLNEVGEDTFKDFTPVKVTLATDIIGEAGYDHVRIAQVDAGENIQFWALDVDGGSNWCDINVAGWGDPNGFKLPATYDATTEIYILSDKVGTYNLNVKLVNVDNDDVLAEVRGTVNVRNRQPSTYKFSVNEDDLDNIAVGEEKTIDVTFGYDQKYEEGYNRVRFKFEVEGPGVATFGATDSEGQPYTATNEGYWGPSDGFDIDAGYEATTPWTVTFSKIGEYTVTVSLIEAPDGDIIADTIAVFTVNVVSEKDATIAAIKPGWEIISIKGICESTENCDEEYMDEVLAKSDLPDALQSEDSVGYEMTIRTSYANKAAAQNSGRSVTTLFTIPEGVTVWYPTVNKENLSEIIWKSTADEANDGDDGWFVLGMEGHPLSAGNIEDDGVVYVDLSETGETGFSFDIKLVDAEWDEVIYGEDTLTATRSQYEFDIKNAPDSIPAVGSLPSGEVIKVTGDNGGGLNAPGDAAYNALIKAVFDDDENGVNLDQYLVQVTLKATTVEDFGYTNKSVRIKELGVQDKDGNDASDKLKVYLYAHTGPDWYDLVQTGWGLEGARNGFNLYKDEDTTLEAYVFGKTAGTYTITFEAVDMSNPTEEEAAVIATGTAEVTVDISVSPLEESSYGAGDNLEFTICGLSPEKEVKVGMPISTSDDWASNEDVLTANMENKGDGLYWYGTTDEYGKLFVSGTVNSNLPSGELYITLPDYGHNIMKPIQLWSEDGEPVRVDTTKPVIGSITVTDSEGDEIEAGGTLSGEVTFAVEVEDENLTQLNIDIVKDSLKGDGNQYGMLQQLNVYADASDPVKDDDTEAILDALGMTVTFSQEEGGGTWTIKVDTAVKTPDIFKDMVPDGHKDYLFPNDDDYSFNFKAYDEAGNTSKYTKRAYKIANNND